MRAQSSTISRQYIIGWDWCARSVMAVWPCHQRPSATMGRKDANCQGRKVPMSHPCQHNHHQKLYRVTPARGFEGDSGIPQATLLGIALPLGTALEGELEGESITQQPYTSLHLSLPLLKSNDYCLLQVQNHMRHLSGMLNSMNLKLHRWKIKS